MTKLSIPRYDGAGPIQRVAGRAQHAWTGCQIEVVMTTTRPVLPLTGGCSCGAIRYDVTSFPLLLYTCNCTDCQRASGSAFALNMPVTATDFHIRQGQPRA